VVANPLTVFTLTPGIDTFTGQAHLDNLFDFTSATLQSTDTITGGATGGFSDVMRMTPAGTIDASQFSGVTNMEELRLSTGTHNVTLANGLVANSSNGYFAVRDGTGDDTVDGSAITNTSIAFFGNGGGDDTFKGGNSDDNFLFGVASLTSARLWVGRDSTG
jgi:hypothetical protein